MSLYDIPLHTLSGEATSLDAVATSLGEAGVILSSAIHSSMGSSSGSPTPRTW